ncbi:NADPH dehydrogenase NamA [Clostridium estertheticum]|uniref:NADPH dehydrogenase NamA n=1 Tax=Clostridium estertheticum TaxID=238834 RepID=UPI001C0E3B52|nr:NADPH dehydrogenase NamA [Clostridium estertheticum]MBU3199732.1 NADPH dehydrogenase NamA [Clostridium estertheticum]WAG68016.1 NADPH dehydrogenase NamA [Clostridium estertheticum]
MSKLFSNFKIKDMDLKNRIVMAPMCMDSCNDKDGFANNWHFIHYSTRAIGGVGLIILESTGIEPGGRITDNDLGIWSDEHIKNLSNIVDECHKYGSKIGIQINHAGRKSETLSYPIIAPSPIAFNGDYRLPVEMTKEDIVNTIDLFKSAAKRALTAGFDLLELHGAHGYLIGEFLSPLTNKRKDEYGGTKENRVRFLKEIIQAVKTVWPETKPLQLRVSAVDYAKGGNSAEETSSLINLIKAMGIDIVNVSSGGTVPAKIATYPGYQICYSEIIRKQCNIPTIAGGLITSPLMAEEILNNKRSDLVYLGRELLRNPYWAFAAANQLGDNIEWPVQYERSNKVNKNGF